MQKGEKNIALLFFFVVALSQTLLLLLHHHNKTRCFWCCRCRFKNRKMTFLLLLKLNNFRRQNFQVFFYSSGGGALNEFREGLFRAGPRFTEGLTADRTAWDGFGARDSFAVGSTKSVFLRCLTVACIFLSFSFLVK